MRLAFTQQSPNYDRNESRCEPDETPCKLCGRPIKDQSKAKQLHFGTGNAVLITEDEPEVGTADDCGYFPVGPNCARKYPELKPFLTDG
jgi:hypothetical protein